MAMKDETKPKAGILGFLDAAADVNARLAAGVRPFFETLVADDEAVEKRADVIESRIARGVRRRPRRPL